MDRTKYVSKNYIVIKVLFCYIPLRFIMSAITILCVSCADAGFISSKRCPPLLLSSHGSNLPKYNKQGINYHVITPNCLLWHNSNQNGPPTSCIDDENDDADDEMDIEDNDDYEEVDDGGGNDLQMF